jgi:hypothetical protein
VKLDMQVKHASVWRLRNTVLALSSQSRVPFLLSVAGGPEVQTFHDSSTGQCPIGEDSCLYWRYLKAELVKTETVQFK